MSSGTRKEPIKPVAPVTNTRILHLMSRLRSLAAAGTAFADPDAEVSMAEISRRAGVGMATLYRNFDRTDPHPSAH
jgi:AcrR family transcriptional regulator